MTNRLLHVIGAASGLGAPDIRCAQAPQALWHAIENASLRWGEVVTPSDDGVPPQGLLQFSRDLANAVAAVSHSGRRIAVIGGDHSCAMGTWRGVARQVDRLGLVWLDAHMDAHTQSNSPSGFWHGMPVANLLGCKGAQLDGEGGVVQPQNLTLIGVRSYEPEEKALLQQLNVTVFTIDDVHRIGFDAVMKVAVQRASDGTDGYGISIDLDGLDPADAPGVGSPVVGGLSARELLSALVWLRDDPGLLAVEIAEFNPVVDVEQKTRRLLMTMLETLTGEENGHESHH